MNTRRNEELTAIRLCRTDELYHTRCLCLRRIDVCAQVKPLARANCGTFWWAVSRCIEKDQMCRHCTSQFAHTFQRRDLRWRQRSHGPPFAFQQSGRCAVPAYSAQGSCLPCCFAEPSQTPTAAVPNQKDRIVQSSTIFAKSYAF